METQRRLGTKQMVILGILTAVSVILSRFFSLNLWQMKIGFGFVPVAMAAILYGPAQGGIVSSLGDLIGAILFPVGPFFPGFTLSAFLTGIVFGFCLHPNPSFPRIFGAVLFTQLGISLGLNTVWLQLLYGVSFRSLLAIRLIQTLVMIPVQLLTIFGLAKLIRQSRKALL